MEGVSMKYNEAQEDQDYHTHTSTATGLQTGQIVTSEHNEILDQRMPFILSFSVLSKAKGQKPLYTVALPCPALPLSLRIKLGK